MRNFIASARPRAALGALILALACSNGTGVESGVDGTWTHQGVPGSGESITLTSRGSELSGSGSWSGEACCSGTLTATGTRRDARVTLDITYSVALDGRVPERHALFEGRVEGDRLAGTMSAGGMSAPFVYVRWRPE